MAVCEVRRTRSPGRKSILSLQFSVLPLSCFLVVCVIVSDVSVCDCLRVRVSRRSEDFSVDERIFRHFCEGENGSDGRQEQEKESKTMHCCSWIRIFFFDLLFFKCTALYVSMMHEINYVRKSKGVK